MRNAFAAGSRRRATLGFCDSCQKEQPTRRALVVLREGERPRMRRICIVDGTITQNLNPWSAAIPSKDATGKTRGSKKEANRGNWLLAASQAGTITRLRFCNDHPRETFRLEVYGTLAVDRLVEHLDQPCSEWNTKTVALLLRELRRSRQLIKSYTPDSATTTTEACATWRTRRGAAPPTTSSRSAS
jgi:hypothetical protein